MFVLLGQRVSTMFRVLSNKGIFGLVKLIRVFLIYQFFEKWKFVYFEKRIEKAPYKLPKLEDSIIIRQAVADDIPQIINDIYPFLTEKEGNDKRFFEQIGTLGFKCFLAEKNNKLVHYSLLFEDALSSPLMQTPILRSKVFKSDAYLGTVFTIPEARGLMIMPHTVLRIFSYLYCNTNFKRLLVIVHKTTDGAEGFYRRNDFNEMINIQKKDLIRFFRIK
jgi:hypothetical protein